MRKTSFNKLKDRDLLNLYSTLMDEFRRRGVVRSSNNPIADYAEKVISKKLHLKLVNCSTRGYDALDKLGKRYQIKARRIIAKNSSRQLGVIRNLDARYFDFLLVGIFDSSFSLRELWKIPYSRIKKYAKYSKHQNGHILILRGPVLTDKFVRKLK